MALAVSCILKTGIFIVGAAGLGAVTHVIYDALPSGLTQPTNSFQLMDRSGYYYIAMLVAVIGGGILSFTQRRTLMRIMSSVVGGSCLVLTTHLIWIQAFETNIPSVATLAILIVSTILGGFLQHFLSKRRARKKRRREDIPVGIAVQ